MIGYMTWIIMISMFLYALLLGTSYWINKNKFGAVALYILGITVLVTPFFSVL